MIPKTIKIGPIQYEIVKTDKLPEEVSGEFVPEQCRFFINQDHHIQQQDVALIHEIVHAILLQGGRSIESEDEDLVCILAHGLLQVLRNNHFLTEHLYRIRF